MRTRQSAPTRSAPLLLKRVLRTIRDQRLFGPGQHLLVAVSGGPDSTALLAMLVRLAPVWRLSLTAVHVNYRLRGVESEEDERFVSTLCKDRGIPLIVLRPTLVKQRRQSSLQARARDARYDAMKTLAREIGADRIAVGHTANDQAETSVMWMLRGAGLTGLAGMPFIRESIIVRPLLASTREEILMFLDQEKIVYRQDSSNATGRYRRNRIRHELLPIISAISPAAIGVLQRQADLLREDDRYLDQVAREQWSTLVTKHAEGDAELDRRAFCALPVALQRRLVRLMLRVYGHERAASTNVVEAARRFILTGKQGGNWGWRGAVVSREGHILRMNKRRQTRALFSDFAKTACDVPVAVPSTVYWAGTNTRFHVQRMSRQEVETLLKNRSKRQALFDADRVSTPLLLRAWRAGDRFCPSGMDGKSKKLQDLFVDLKITRDQRERVPVLSAPEGILWVAGIRQDDRFLVSKGCRNCLVVSMIDGPGRETRNREGVHD